MDVRRRTVLRLCQQYSTSPRQCSKRRKLCASHHAKYSTRSNSLDSVATKDVNEESAVPSTSTSNPGNHGRLSSKDITRTMDLLSRCTNSQTQQKWSHLIESLIKDEPSDRKRIGVLDLSQRRRSNFMAALVGYDTLDLEAKMAFDDRWRSVPSTTGRILIRNGDKLSRFGPILGIPSSRLRELDAEILEIRGPEHDVDLLRTDLPIVIINPKSKTETGTLPAFLNRLPHALCLVDIKDADSTLDHATHPTDSGQPRRQMVNLEGSKTSEGVTSMIHGLLEQGPKEGRWALIEQLAIWSMLDECKATLNASLNSIEAAKKETVELEYHVSTDLKDLQVQFESIHIPEELHHNKDLLKRHIDAFRWMRFWEVDDIGDLLVAEIITGYGVELERKLEWLAGSMSQVQSRIIQTTRTYLQNLPEPGKSAVLINQFEQLCTTTPPISPSYFTSAVSRRRKQLTEIAVPYLQSKFLGRFYKGLVGMPISIGVPTLLCINEIMSTTTAIPVGLLGLVACLRYIAGAWEKGRRKLWADYNRVGLGLAEDVQRVVESTLKNRVEIFPRVAVEGVRSQVAKQEASIKKLVKDVERVEQDLETGDKSNRIEE